LNFKKYILSNKETLCPYAIGLDTLIVDAGGTNLVDVAIYVLI
jgi:hypothetical protein